MFAFSVLHARSTTPHHLRLLLISLLPTSRLTPHSHTPSRSQVLLLLARALVDGCLAVEGADFGASLAARWVSVCVCVVGGEERGALCVCVCVCVCVCMGGWGSALQG